MTTRRMFQELSRLLPTEKINPVLSAFKYNTLFWKTLNDTALVDQISTEWNFADVEFSPSSLALFVVDADLLGRGYPNCSLDPEFLEQVMLKYESALSDGLAVTSLRQAGELAIAICEKFKVNADWNALLHELLDIRKFENAAEVSVTWGTTFTVLCGWLEEKNEFLQSLLLFKSPSFGFPIVKNILFSLPLDEQERVGLLKGALTLLSLDQQISALQSLRQAGKTELARRIAQGLFERYLVGNLEEKPAGEIWQNSEKSLSSGVYSRELAALAQIAGEDEIAEKLLKNVENILTAELSGVKIQQLSLKEESNSAFSQEEILLAPTSLEDRDVKKEYRLIVQTSTAQPKNLLNELEESQEGDESVNCEMSGLRALNWTPRQQVKHLIAVENWETANEWIDPLLALAPDDHELLEQKAQVANALHNAAQYQLALEDLALFERDNVAVKRELARSYELEADWQSAFDHYDDLINHFGVTDPDDLLGYAQSAVEVNQANLAIEASQKVLNESPENGRALAIKGYAEYRSGRTEQAIANLSRAVEVAPEMSEPWRLLAQVYYEKGEIIRSIDTLRTAHTAVPADRQIKRMLAEELIAQGQASEAITVLNSDDISGETDLATALLKIQAMKKLNLPELESTIEKTYRTFSTQPDAIHEYADLMLRKGEQEKSCKLSEPLAFSDKSTIAWKLTYADSVLGQDYRHILGMPEVEISTQQKAEQVLAEILQVEPENLYAGILSGEVLLKNGEAEKAFNLFSNLLNNSEAQSSNWLERIQAGFAWAANLLGKINYALAGIQSVMEVNPNWAGARETLAEVSASSGEIEEAVVQANQVLESAADVAESAEWFAGFMANLGRTEEAEKAILNLAKTHTQKLTLLLKASELKLSRGDKEGAKQTLNPGKHLLAKTQSDQELVRAAKIFDQAGDSEFAAECLKMRSALPGTSQQNVLSDLAGYYRSEEKYDLALAALEGARQKLGKQNWIKLIQAEVLHAKGESAIALETMNQAEQANPLLPEVNRLNFVPANWKALLQENTSADTLAAELAFETGNYSLAWEKLGAAATASEKVTRIETGYALGNEKETLAFLDVDVNQPELYADATLAAEIAETMLDAGQQEKASTFIGKAVELFPQDVTLALTESRVLAENGQLIQAEDLLDQALQKSIESEALSSAQATLTVRNLIKAAVECNRWEEAKSWSAKLSAAQPKNLMAVKIALEVFLLAVEFVKLVANLGVNRHLHTDSKSVETMRFELQKRVAEAEAIQNAALNHLILRAKMALDPSQANIRAMAMNAPQKGDVVAMMIALKESGQATTAVQLAKKQPATADILYASAFCLQESAPALASEANKQSLKLLPSQPWAAVLAAKLAQKNGETYAAITEMDEALQYWPNEPQWHILSAEYWRTTGNQQEAVAHYEAAAALEPEDNEIQLLLGKAYLNNKESDKATAILASVSKTEVNNYEVWESLAEAYYSQQDFANALNAAERASSVNGFSLSSAVLSAKIHLANGDKKKSLELAQKAAQLDAENAEVQLLLAKTWLVNGDKAQALQALEKAVHARNATLEVLVDHAKLIKEINGAANARPLFESLVQRYPDNTDLLNLLAEAQLACGDKVAAESCAQRSIKLNDLQPKLQQFLGKLEMENGYLDQAIHHYSQAIAQAPQQIEVYLDLSNAYQQQREYDEALRTLQMAIDLDPRDTRPLLAAVNLMRNAKDYANAEALLRKAANIAPNDLNIRRQLGAVIALNMVHSSQEASSHV